MQEPVLARGGVHPAALVRAVDRRFPLRQHHFPLVGAVDVFRPQRQLPAARHAAGGGEDVVVAVALVELGALDGGVLRVPVEHQRTIVQQAGSIRIHAAYQQRASHGRTAGGEGVHEVGLAVVVPERTGIDPALSAFDQQRRAPGTGGGFGLHHVDAEIGIGIEDVDFAVVAADGGRPGAVAVSRPVVDVERRLGGEGVSDQFPVHQVFGMEDRQARHGVEAGRGEVVVLADAEHVGVGVIGVQDGIAIGAVAVVGHPHLGAVGRRHLGGQCRSQRQRASQRRRAREMG